MNSVIHIFLCGTRKEKGGREGGRERWDTDNIPKRYLKLCQTKLNCLRMK